MKLTKILAIALASVVAFASCGPQQVEATGDTRVLNRTFALRVLTQRRMARPWIAIPVNQKKAYFSLCIIKYFLDIISPNNDMKAKIDALLSSYPSIDINAMGFPRGWENEPLWR